MTNFIKPTIALAFGMTLTACNISTTHLYEDDTNGSMHDSSDVNIATTAPISAIVTVEPQIRAPSFDHLDKEADEYGAQQPVSSGALAGSGASFTHLDKDGAEQVAGVAAATTAGAGFSASSTSASSASSSPEGYDKDAPDKDAAPIAPAIGGSAIGPVTAAPAQASFASPVDDGYQATADQGRAPITEGPIPGTSTAPTSGDLDKDQI